MWKPVGDKTIARKNRVRFHGMILNPNYEGEYDGTAVVVAVSVNSPWQLKVGDRVVVAPHGGVECEVLGKDVVILFPQEILAHEEKTPSLDDLEVVA